MRGLPDLADLAIRLGGSPHLLRKRDQIKMRDYMDRKVTPPKRVTSLTGVPHLHVNRLLITEGRGRGVEERKFPRGGGVGKCFTDTFRGG